MAKQQKLSKNELQKFVETKLLEFGDLLETLPEDRKVKLKEMLAGNLGDAFYCAPSSTQEDYHNCYPGGLVVHSVNVVNNLYSLNDAFKLDFEKSQLTFLGLFHDLGKAGDGEYEYFLPVDSKWHNARKIFFEYNKDCSPMLVSDRTIFLLQNHGISLSYDEFLALKLAEADPETIPSYRHREPVLALLLQWANRMSFEQ